MLPVTFRDLVKHMGEFLAWQCLEQIEKAANIQPNDAAEDPETRLAKACNLQDLNLKAVVVVSDLPQQVS